MANVYTIQMMEHAIVAGPGTYSSAAVPTGYVWVVRDISIGSTSPFNAQYQGFGVYKQEGTVYIPIFLVNQWDTYPGPYYHWVGHAVLAAGQNLYVQLNDYRSWGWSIAGYQLTLP